MGVIKNGDKCHFKTTSLEALASAFFMKRLRYSFHEIMITALGLSLLAFFGTLSFLPMEIQMMGEGQTIFWIFISIAFGIILAFLWLSFVDKKYYYLISRILTVAMVICVIFVIHEYLIFTQDLFEPWLIQIGWFLRYRGFVVGIFLGFVAANTIVNLSSLIYLFKSTSDDEIGSANPAGIGTLILVGLSFALYSIEMLIFRYWSFLILFILIFILGCGLLALSMVFLQNQREINFIQKEELYSSTEVSESVMEEAERTSKSQKPIRIIHKINSKLRNPREFWRLSLPLLVLLIFGIVLLAIYPLNLIIHIAFPYEVGVLEYDMPVNQLFSYLFIMIIFIIALFGVYGGRMRRRLVKYYNKGIKASLKVSVFGFIDALRFIGLFLVISQILYFFEYPVYLPEVISYNLLFGVVGAVIYYVLGRKLKYQKLVYCCSILLLVLNFYLIYCDGLNNLTNVVSGEFDILFPFVYLHNWPNFILTGIPVGIILSDLLLNFAFKYTDGTDSPNRAITIVSSAFMLGMLFTPGNFLLNNPGGDPPLTDQSFFTFYIFTIALSIVLVVGLVFNYLITEILIPRFIERKTKFKRPPLSRIGSKLRSKKQKQRVKNVSRNKQLRGGLLVALIGMSFAGGFFIYYSYAQTYQRPMVAYSPGNYVVWVQNSTERVGRNTQICTSSSPKVEMVNLSVAKNEYAAIQLVWRPLGHSINALTYQITNFEHQNASYNISAVNCNLRYVDLVIDREFPDILKTFTTMNLEKKENYVFWLAVRTPYDTVEGDYRGEVVFQFNGDEEVHVKVQLHVWNFTIPKMRHLRTNIGGRSADLVRINNYIEHRINDYGVDFTYTDNYTKFNTEGTYTCYLNKTSDTWIFNWTAWDGLIQYKLDSGMNAFTLTYPLGLADGRDPYLEDLTRMKWLKNWFSKVQTHMEIKNWLNYSYIYFIDEFSVFIPAPYSRQEYFNRCRILLSEIKNASPKLKIMTTTPPTRELEPLREYIDIFCPISNDRDKERWDERLNARCEFWFYTCVGPTAPWPNVMLYDRLYEARILMWQVWRYNIHGFLFWHSQAYYHGKYGLGFNGWGDGWFLYEQGGELYDSIRWEMFLEGQEDYEYLWLLNATLNYLSEHPGIIPVETISQYRTELNSITNAVVGEKWVYCDHVDTLYNGRDRVGAILNDLGKIVNQTIFSEAIWLPPYKPGI
ncbi:MAG: glycoside hydrolase domain-containing protein [Candidatus Helarchaeota archaeon]